MDENKNDKSKIWIYAVILFTSAFIVLLLTAYSQIKLNKNISDYRNQIYTKESEKNKIRLNFANAQELNAKLQEEIQKLQEDKDKLTQDLKKSQKDLEDIQKKNQQAVNIYELLSEAQLKYLQGNVVDCAVILHQGIDVSFLGEKTREAYNALVEKSFKEAGKQLYETGHELFIRKENDGAIEKLKLSHELAPNESFSDNALYYLANAEHRNGNNADALKDMQLLVQAYPDSPFVKTANSFIRQYGQKNP